jgi:predicted nucleotidyltransferase
MWLRFALDDVLSSRTKVRLLRALVTSPRPLTGRELARATGMAQSNVSVAIKQLVAAGIVTARVVQPAVEFSLRSSQEPVLKALRALFDAEDQAFADAITTLSGEVPGLVSLILFGSAARGTHRSDSDTDLLIVVERVDAALEAQIADVCQEISERSLVGLSWIVRDRAQVREWARIDDPLWRNIREDGVALAGSPLYGLVD